MNATVATADSRCRGCHTTYICYGHAMKWTYINAKGPYCDECMKKGVVMFVETRKDK